MKGWKWQFSIIYSGQAFSLIGSAAVQFAIIWWLTVQTGSAVVLTIASVIGFVPGLLLSPYAGVLADKFNKKIIMICADGLVALSSIGLAVAFIIKAPTVWFVYSILFIRSVGSVFHSTTMEAAIPLLVPKEMLTKTGGWANMINAAGNMIGPLLGAALVELLPMEYVMSVDVIGAIFAIVCLFFVKIPIIVNTTAEKTTIRSDISAGWEAIKSDRAMRILFIPLVCTYIVFAPISSLFPLYIQTHFNGSAWHVSLVQISAALGILISSLVLGLWGQNKNRFTMFSVACIFMGICLLTVYVLPAGAFWVFLGFVFIYGVGSTLTNVPVRTYIQERMPKEHMGKVFSLIGLAGSASVPIGLLIAGPLAEVIGIAIWFLCSGLVLAAIGIYAMLRLRKYDRIAPLEMPVELE